MKFVVKSEINKTEDLWEPIASAPTGQTQTEETKGDDKASPSSPTSQTPTKMLVEENLTFSLSKLSVQKASIPTTTTPGEQRLHGLKRSMAGDFFDEDEEESIGEQPAYGKRNFEEMNSREGKETEVKGEGGGSGGDDFKAVFRDGGIALEGAVIPMRLEDLREEDAAVGGAELAALEEIRVDETGMEGSEAVSGNYGEGEKKKKRKKSREVRKYERRKQLRKEGE